MKQQHVHIAHIIQAVADAAGLTQALMLLDEESPYVYRCRWLVFLLAREMTIFTNLEIGRRLNRTETSVGQGAGRARRLLLEDPQLMAIKARAEEALHARHRKVSQ